MPILTQAVTPIGVQQTLDYVLCSSVDMARDIQLARQDLLIYTDGVIVIEGWEPGFIIREEQFQWRVEMDGCNSVVEKDDKRTRLPSLVIFSGSVTSYIKRQPHPECRVDSHVRCRHPDQYIDR